MYVHAEIRAMVFVSRAKRLSYCYAGQARQVSFMVTYDNDPGERERKSDRLPQAFGLGRKWVNRAVKQPGWMRNRALGYVYKFAYFRPASFVARPTWESMGFWMIGTTVSRQESDELLTVSFVTDWRGSVLHSTSQENKLAQLEN